MHIDLRRGSNNLLHSPANYHQIILTLWLSLIQSTANYKFPNEVSLLWVFVDCKPPSHLNMLIIYVFYDFHGREIIFLRSIKEEYEEYMRKFIIPNRAPPFFITVFGCRWIHYYSLSAVYRMPCSHLTAVDTRRNFEWRKWRAFGAHLFGSSIPSTPLLAC